MFISPREAADLCLQMALALILTVSGMALASTVVEGSERRVSVIDVNRPLLWSAGPIHVERAKGIGASLGREMAVTEEKACHDMIGLRMPCDLLSFSVSSNF